MANTFYLKKGDTFPNMTTQLSDDTGTPLDLTGATILCRISITGEGNPLIERAATMVTPQTGANIGKCSFEFLDGDSDVVGTHHVEWRVTFANGKISTFPRGGKTDKVNFNFLEVQEIVT